MCGFPVEVQCELGFQLRLSTIRAFTAANIWLATYYVILKTSLCDSNPCPKPLATQVGGFGGRETRWYSPYLR